MLEKIVNISSNQPYQGKKGNGRNFEKFLSKPRNNKIPGKDSITFSPGAAYLSRINWGLKDIKYQNDDKVLVEFIIDGFDFLAEINFAEFYTEGKQKYKISNKNDFNEENKKSLIELSVNKGQIILDQNFNKVQLPALKSLFEKISNYGDEVNELFDYNRLLIGIEKDLQLEFQSISNHLYNFINKLGKFNIVSDFIFSMSDSSALIIEKITVVNA